MFLLPYWWEISLNQDFIIFRTFAKFDGVLWTHESPVLAGLGWTHPHQRQVPKRWRKNILQRTRRFNFSKWRLIRYWLSTWNKISCEYCFFNMFCKKSMIFLSSIIHIIISHLSLLLFGMLQKRNSSFFHIQIIYHNNSSHFKPFAFEGRCFKRSKIAQRIYTFITGQIDRFWLYRNSQSCQ